jgi:hypothetical protein
MNFNLPPPTQNYRHTFGRGSRRGNIYGIGSGRHSSDKARYGRCGHRVAGFTHTLRYIHANYRFIVKPNGDYKQQAVNADQHLDWNDVLQILASAVSQEASCPICLSHPVAPRMAKCGHIFCLPCLIRYMHSSDDVDLIPEKKARWKKCPICWDSVYIAETRPVRWYTGQEGPQPHEGDDVVLRLVMRQPGSTVALPRDGADTLEKSEDVPWYFAAEVTDYARIMKGGEEYMIQQFDAEIEDLRRQENEDELMFGEDPEWTRKAIKAVTEAKERVKGIGDPPSPKLPTEKKPKKPPIQFNPVNEEDPAMYFIQHASISGLSLSNGTHGSSTPAPSNDHAKEVQPTPHLNRTKGVPIQSHPRPKEAHSSLNEAHPADSPYYFYQALLHYYLAPLDIRILKSAFGNFAAFPSTLLPRVERVSTGHIMDEDLRKRAKYLAHLPYGCEVGFLECNWTDVVPPEVLAQFKEDIERRRQRNRDKETREERDRLRAEKAEDDARWANARRKRPGSVHESYVPEDFNSPVPASIDASDGSPPWPTRQGSSFATLASPSTSPSAPRTVWGTVIVPPASPETLAQQPEATFDDGWLSSWEQDLIVENELVAQVQASSLKGAENDDARPSGGGGGRKKKAKKITLMSTNARRAA